MPSLGQYDQIEILTLGQERLCKARRVRRVGPIVRTAVGEQYLARQPIGEIQIRRFPGLSIEQTDNGFCKPALRNPHIVRPGRGHRDIEKLRVL